MHSTMNHKGRRYIACLQRIPNIQLLIRGRIESPTYNIGRREDRFSPPVRNNDNGDTYSNVRISMNAIVRCIEDKRKYKTPLEGEVFTGES